MLSKKIVIFIISPEQISSALAISRKETSRGHQAVLLALTPHASYALERRDIEHRCPEQYYQEDELHALGAKQLDEQDEWSAKVDEWLQQEIPLLASMGLAPANVYWYPLKTLVNSVAAHLFIISRIIEKETPDYAVVLKPAEETVREEILYFTEEEKPLWFDALLLVLRESRISFRVVKNPLWALQAVGMDILRRPGAKQKALRAVDLVLGGPGKISAAIQFAKSLLRRDEGKMPAQPVLLSLRQAYGFKYLKQELEKRGGSFSLYCPDLSKVDYTPASNAGMVQKLEKIWALAVSTGWFRAFFKLGRLDSWEIVEMKLRHFFLKEISAMAVLHEKSAMLLDACRPFAVATSAVDVSAKIIASACRSRSIPFVVLQHGSDAGYMMMESYGNFYAYQNDARWSDYCVLYGEGDKAYLEKYYPDTAKAVVAGSPQMDLIIRGSSQHASRREKLEQMGLDPDKRTIIYVPTTMDGNFRPTPFRGRSPGNHFLIEKAIVSMLARYPEHQFIVKLSPSRTSVLSPVLDLLRQLNISHGKALMTPAFTDMVWLGDLFVIDYTAASFLEALCTDKPVLVCGWEMPMKFNPQKWHPHVLPAWTERVRYSENMEDFLGILKGYLEKDQWESYSGTGEMVRRYATCGDDGRSSERLVEFFERLSQIAGSHQPKAFSLKTQTFRAEDFILKLVNR